MKKIDKPLLDEVVRRLIDEFKPDKIILFGSHAWGKPNVDSDVDILVVVKSAENPPTRRAAKAYRCLQGLKIPVEIIINTQEELEKYRSVPASLTRRILEEGKVLYGELQR